MGVYIRGAKIPSECGKCFVGAKEEICGAWYPNCPLVEVAEPHGRLIDADALEEVNINWATGDVLPIDWSTIAYAPTVIEAEGE